jgi:AraC family transcriptional regulator of adaptative response/methylated-DNA-[protein]-cysteine methyltransferase
VCTDGEAETAVIVTVSWSKVMFMPKDHVAGTAVDHDAERWDAVQRKDANRDGDFVFAVRSTGVYCRPSCAARQPLRRNVEFFEAPAAARAAGYRACKRCDPDGSSTREKQVQAILAACRLIEQAEERMSLATLARKVGLSAYHFHRLFKDVTGVTPRDYHRARQIARLNDTLKDSPSVTAAIYDAGFNSAGRFYDHADALLGMTASSYRRGGAGEEIRYAVQTCALGLVLVAATGRGVCTIEFGDTVAELTARLHERFPKAQFRPADAEFSAWLQRVLDYLQAPGSPSSPQLDLPLDVRGTAFQQQVWKALREIPAGSTSTYTAVAEKIGRPSAVRAVAQAIASNPVAVAVPCHRVLRSDGSLSGYRWGVERKEQLLVHEQARPARSKGPR